MKVGCFRDVHKRNKEMETTVTMSPVFSQTNFFSQSPSKRKTFTTGPIASDFFMGKNEIAIQSRIYCLFQWTKKYKTFKLKALTFQWFPHWKNHVVQHLARIKMLRESIPIERWLFNGQKLFEIVYLGNNIQRIVHFILDSFLKIWWWVSRMPCTSSIS